jgi:hypothetical protein
VSVTAGPDGSARASVIVTGPPPGPGRAMPMRAAPPGARAREGGVMGLGGEGFRQVAQIALPGWRR